jgi:hypothetical protein
MRELVLCFTDTICARITIVVNRQQLSYSRNDRPCCGTQNLNSLIELSLNLDLCLTKLKLEEGIGKQVLRKLKLEGRYRQTSVKETQA